MTRIVTPDDELRHRKGWPADQVLTFDPSTVWEFVDTNGLPTRRLDSLGRARSASPNQLLMEAVLGAMPVDSGYTWPLDPDP